MGSQQFCLKWNNHQSNMLAVFEQLLSNEALVDVTLACEGLSLKAHKMVLSACSPFFQALFVENPCKHPIVILKDMRYMDLKAIVEFMYRGEVNVSQDHLTALLKTAETLKVKGLAEVTNENKNGGLVTSVDGAADAKPVGTPRAESPPLSKRKRGRPRRRSPSDSNKSDSEDGPPATRIKGPDSPEIIEDGSMSSDRVTNLPAASPSSRTSTNVAASSTAVPSGARLGSSVQATISQHTQDSMGDDVGEGDDPDYPDVEPLNVMEQSMTTENVPVFPDVASSSQALGDESQQSHHTGSTSDNSALVPVHPSLPSDISITSQDIKPSPSSLIPYDDQTISPVVAASPAAALSGDGASTALAVMDASGVPAIAGPSSYQQSTPSHVPVVKQEQAQLFPDWPPSVEIEHAPVMQPQDVGQSAYLPASAEIASRAATHQEQSAPPGHNLQSGTSPTCHRVTTHDACGGGMPHKCTYCSKGFMRRHELLVHYRSHPAERPHQCCVCSNRFTQKSHLLIHLRTHTGDRPYKCHLCGNSFALKESLEKHFRTHTGSRPYKCDICNKGFTTSSTVIAHRRTHTGEMPFRCQLCPKAFIQSSNLQRHLRTHKGAKPFKCNNCEEAFRERSELKAHKKEMHTF